MSDDSSGVFGSRGEQADGAGEASGDSSASRLAGGPDPEKPSPHHRGNSSPESAGTAGRMERLGSPAPAGRKVTRKACNVERRERGGLAQSEGREERTLASRSGESVARLRESERDTERNGRERTGREEAFKTIAMHCMDNEGRGGSLSTQCSGVLQTFVTGGRARSDGPWAGMTSSTATTSSRPAPGYKSTALQRPPIRSWPMPPPPPPPPPQKTSQRPAPRADPLHRTPRTPTREPDPLWRSEARPRSRSRAGRNRLPSGCRTVPGGEDDENRGFMQAGERGEEGGGEEEAGSWAGAGGNGAAVVISPALTPAALTRSSVAESDRSRSRREKNRVRSQRRRQRRREIWRQSRQQDSRQVNGTDYD